MKKLQQYQFPARYPASARKDGERPDQLRWHQVIQPLDLNALQEDSLWPGERAVALIGFCSEEGIKRNLGRPGAAEGPGAIRKALASLPVHHPLQLLDAGDLHCLPAELEQAQQELSLAIRKLVSRNIFPIVLGGGHEVSFGHFAGLHAQFPDQKIGIINLDAHFDNRIPPGGSVNSGTGFWQIEQLLAGKHPMQYLALGIQQMSNTKELFLRADKSGIQYVSARDFRPDRWPQISQTITDFCARADRIYLTIDLDVFAQGFAPGVSAPNPRGIYPDSFFEDCLQLIFGSGKVISMDIAELSPPFDRQEQTARLAAWLIFEVLAQLSS